MVKAAVILGAFSVGNRPLDMVSPLSNPRGMTGTEICFKELCDNLEILGWEVHQFTVFNGPEGKFLHRFEDRIKLVDDTFDVIISINEPNVLMEMTTKPLKIVWMMLNDFSFIRPGFDEFVDLYFGVCNEHTEHMKKQVPRPDKWSTIPLGCTAQLYSDQRVPGLVIYCSSHDRGLHWLLQEWPTIKSEVPHASLRIFYHQNYDQIDNVEHNSRDKHPHLIEMAARIKYIRNAIKRLKPLDVEYVGSVSRDQMVKEYSEAEVFAFPTDTIAFSEGFSCSSLEACAATVPIIGSTDCLGGIYAESGAIMIPSPVNENIKDYFTPNVIKVLKNREFANKIRSNCRKFAEKHTWTNSVKKLENIILERLNERTK